MAYTIPPANKVAGQSGFITDIDNAYAALAAVAGVNVLDSQWSGGADPTGVSASDAAFAAAAGGLPLSGGMIVVPPGTYRLNTGVTVVLGTGAGPVQWWLQPGATIEYYGTGDCFRMYSTVTSSPSGTRSGIVGAGTIDGTNAGNGACGVHVGDISMLKLEGIITGFGGTGSIGLHLDNTVTWTEEADVRMEVKYCTQNVVMEVTTGYPSFDYGNWDFTILANAGMDGVVIQNGADLYSTALLRIRGNFFTSASPFTNYVLRVNGTAPGGSQSPGHASALRGNLDVQVETDSGLANAHIPVSVNAANLLNCMGKIWLLGFQNNSTAPQGSFFFSGSISGDTVMNPNSSGGIRNFGAATVFPQPLAALSLPSLPTQYADFFTFTLSASITVSLTGGNPTTAGPQRKTIIIKQAASGGPYTVTWPHAGSPTNSSPTVLWAGGTAPTMTAAASAVDKYDLSTYDGITWYGSASQNLS